MPPPMNVNFWSAITVTLNAGGGPYSLFGDTPRRKRFFVQNPHGSGGTMFVGPDNLGAMNALAEGESLELLHWTGPIWAQDGGVTLTFSALQEG